MELLKEAKNVVDFATYYPLLNKATIDNDTPIPGYLFQDIIKLSHQSVGHRQLLLDFLLARLNTASWPGKQKVVRVLRELCSRGHRGLRVNLRGRDGELRKAAATGGPPDPLLANTPQLFLSSAIQELLSELFDPKTLREDEAWLAGHDEGSEDRPDPIGGQGGYGASASEGGRYQGFGSTPNTHPDNIVTQVRGLVERVMSPQTDSRRLATDLLGGGDKGDYRPLSLPSLGPSIPSPASQPQPQITVLAASRHNKYKAHKKGKAGGGWETDEEDEFPPLSPPSPLPPFPDLSLGLLGDSLGRQEGTGGAEETFLATKIDPNSSWPVDHDLLVSLCRDCSAFNLNKLLEKVGTRVSRLIGTEERPHITAESLEKLSQDLLMSTSLTSSLSSTDMSFTSTTTSPPFADTTTSKLIPQTSASDQISMAPSTTPSTSSNITSTFSSSTQNPPTTNQNNPMLSNSTLILSNTNQNLFTTPSSTSTKLLLLLLLVEFGLHYEVFPPALVNSALGKVLADVNKEGVDRAVRVKARKLSLIVAKLV